MGKLGDELILELSSDIGNSQSARVIIPLCHIYLEHLMNLLIEKEYDKSVQFLSNSKNGFYEKLHKLCDLNLLSVDEHYNPNLKLIYELILLWAYHSPEFVLVSNVVVFIQKKELPIAQFVMIQEVHQLKKNEFRSALNNSRF